jgi:hypothetical protein
MTPEQCEEEYRVQRQWLVGRTVTEVAEADGREGGLKVSFADGSTCTLRGWDDGTVFVEDRKEGI